MSDQSLLLQQQVKDNIEHGRAMQIAAGGSKSFLAQEINGETLSVKQHSGIVKYEPTELVITARCGTPLQVIRETLAEQNQMLAFEPPAFSDQATIGGCIAAGLSGPRRPFSGAARDTTLGSKLINGDGEIVHFGGEVMKNVAGYDVSRLLVGSMGTLGIILEVSLKVLPIAESEVTTSFEINQQTSIERVNQFCSQAIPVTASCFDGKRLYVRLSGTESGVKRALDTLGGEPVANTDKFWEDIKEHHHPLFDNTKRIWRLSVRPATPPLEINGDQLIEWRGALRWLATAESPENVRDVINKHGGHATIFRNAIQGDEIFHPLSGKVFELHRNLKQAMDPHGLFNPGRMYRGL